MTDIIYLIENMEHGYATYTGGGTPHHAAEWFISYGKGEHQYSGCRIGESSDGWLYPVFDAEGDHVDDLMVDVYTRQPRPREDSPRTQPDSDGMWFRA